MSTSELEIRKLLADATFYIKNAEEDETFLVKCKECMDLAYSALMENTRNSYAIVSAEIIVLYAEVALLTNNRDQEAERTLDIFFQRFT
jgi:hypothetical protein